MIEYVVRLTEEERSSLTELVSKGKAAARKIRHANVLLKIDAGGPSWSDAQAAEAFNCSARTVASASDVSKRVLRRRWNGNHANIHRVHGFSTARVRRSCCDWPAPRPLKDRPAGP